MKEEDRRGPQTRTTSSVRDDHGGRCRFQQMKMRRLVEVAMDGIAHIGEPQRFRVGNLKN